VGGGPIVGQPRWRVRKRAANGQSLRLRQEEVVDYSRQRRWGKADFVSSIQFEWRRFAVAMFLIAGSFRITGAQPDGDSIRFTPDDPAKWDLITGPNRVKRNGSGSAQLRLDAIDALETHYGNPRTHQPLSLAHAAATELLDWLGFSNVGRAQDETVTSSTPATVAGYILTRSADLYGRCIAVVGRGAPPNARRIGVLPRRRRVENHRQPPPLQARGRVPDVLPRAVPDLRNELTAAAQQARDGRLGVWASDATTSGFDVTGLDALQDDIVIVPKLFRRLVDYLHLGDDSMAGFPAFLDQAADKFFILSTGHSTTGLDAVVKVAGNNVRMTRPIEDLVFDEK
jgi:endonuclease YncB( thermonuclease family)